MNRDNERAEEESSDESDDEDDIVIPVNGRGRVLNLRQQAKVKRNQIAATLPIVPRVPGPHGGRRQIRRRNEE